MLQRFERGNDHFAMRAIHFDAPQYARGGYQSRANVREIVRSNMRAARHTLMRTQPREEM